MLISWKITLSFRGLRLSNLLRLKIMYSIQNNTATTGKSEVLTKFAHNSKDYTLNSCALYYLIPKYQQMIPVGPISIILHL